MIKFIKQKDGPTIGYSEKSGVTILEVDGLKFKDLNKNGVLDPYEDWRLPIEERIQDLVKRMSVHEIAGLMLYSKHQAVSSANDIFSKMFAGHYDGKLLSESDADVSDMTDEQKEFLSKDNVRHVLVTTVDNAKTAAKWSNNLQAFVEGKGLGIPVNISSDPRHTPSAHTEFNAGSGGDIFKWPEPLGLAATFDEKLVERFGNIAAQEYRAMGITTALSPQIDLATEPRWMRFNGTFGEDTRLATDLARAYIDGFQTTSDTNGWGSLSVNAMVKHWPGGGSGEGGRDAHYGYGKYAVYPGSNFTEHMKPFLDGAFKLNGGTQKASAVMPYYTISYDQDKVYNENVGNSYSKYIIQDLLRTRYEYDGVVCTDWMITQDTESIDSFMTGKSWGVETLTEAQRHYKILEAGVDQFGGNNEIEPVLEAYQIGVCEHGEDKMRLRFETSAKRLLRNIFHTGLFENPYLDPEVAQEGVGNPNAMKEGYEAQVKSVVMLKNHNHVLPIKERKKIYIPNRRINEGYDWFGNIVPVHEEDPVNRRLVSKYYDIVETPSEADFAIVLVMSPQSQGYDAKEGYLPLSLQYRPYTATAARKESIADDRSYFGKSTTTTNEQDLDIILETKEAIGNKPVIVVMNIMNPTVVKEFEKDVDGILIHFNIQHQAIMDIISGRQEPSGLLPFQMPANMETVEKQYEDVAHDMECHIDEDNNEYDFAFGLNFEGIIEDERTKKYSRK